MIWQILDAMDGHFILMSEDSYSSLRLSPSSRAAKRKDGDLLQPSKSHITHHHDMIQNEKTHSINGRHAHILVNWIFTRWYSLKFLHRHMSCGLKTKPAVMVLHIASRD